MSTTKQRINITLPNDTNEAVRELAKRDNVPTATKVSELVKIALEIEEDQVLGEIAAARDVKGAKFVSHEEAWR